jgi:hypothetical protein
MRFLIIVLLLSGCATTYESGLGSNSGGYFEQRISDNNYLVSFRGNKFTTDEKAHFYALLRALEIGLELDYKYMLIQSADSRPEITQSTVNLPTYTTTTGNVAGETFYANTMSSTPTNFTSRKPRYFLNVSFFTEMPEGKFLKDKLFEIQPDLVNLKIKIDDVKSKESTWHLKPGKSKNPAIPNVLRNR